MKSVGAESSRLSMMDLLIMHNGKSIIENQREKTGKLRGGTASSIA